MNEPWEATENRNSVSGRWLSNPFYFVAGGKSMIYGMGIIVLTAMLAFLSSARLDGTLDFHPAVGSEFPLWLAFAEGFVAWLSLAVPLFIAGRIFSASRPRPVDVFGTQALARAPYLLLVLLAFWRTPWQYAQKMLPGAPQTGGVSGMIAMAVAIIAMLIIIIWAIWLMYKAFSHSCNLSGGKAAIIFFVCLLVAEGVSKAVLIPISPEAPVQFTRPEVIESVPADGAVDVDPSLGEIRVTFNKTMRDSCWSWCYEDREKYPETVGGTYYNEECTTITLPVKLEPAKEYVIWINKGQYRSFQDLAGNRVQDTRITFTTR